MGRDFIKWLALGLILALPQRGQAGERSAFAKATARQAPVAKTMAAHGFGAMSGGRSDFHHAALARSHGNVTGEYSFSPVSALVTRRSGRSEVRNDAPSGKGVTDRAKNGGPATTPSERKTLTFFRLNPKFGDVSVQPVVGGVNGAQLSVGF